MVQEVKNPYKIVPMRSLNMPSKSDSCLSTSADGLIQLIETHAYYGQIIVECCSSCSLLLFIIAVKTFHAIQQLQKHKNVSRY